MDTYHEESPCRSSAVCWIWSSMWNISVCKVLLAAAQEMSQTRKKETQREKERWKAVLLKEHIKGQDFHTGLWVKAQACKSYIACSKSTEPPCWNCYLQIIWTAEGWEHNSDSCIKWNDWVYTQYFYIRYLIESSHLQLCTYHIINHYITLYRPVETSHTLQPRREKILI